MIQEHQVQKIKQIGGPYLWVEQVGVDHGPFDVIQVSIVLQSSLQKTRLLTQLSHMGPVIVSEHLVPQDGICHLNKTI